MQQSLVAGFSLNFLTSVIDYPASQGWELRFRLVPRTTGNPVIELTATPEGDAYRTTVAPGVTTTWAAGSYTWFSWVEKPGEKYPVESGGQIAIHLDPSAAVGGYDGRTLARTALDDARAALAAWKPTQRRYKIGEREMEFNSSSEIVKVISYWESEVQREERAAGLASGRPDRRKSYVRFTRA